MYDIISSHPFFKTENPQRTILLFALWQYFNIELNKSLAQSWFHVLIIKQVCQN